MVQKRSEKPKKVKISKKQQQFYNDLPNRKTGKKGRKR